VDRTATGEATSPKKNPHGRGKPQGQTPTQGEEGRRKKTNRERSNRGEQGEQPTRGRYKREDTSFLFINKD